MGLREIKKQKTYTQILQSAKKMFLTKGFKNTSMIKIAEDAEVGAGTIYNYFSTKGAILITVLSNEVEQMKDDKFSNLMSCRDGDLVELINEIMNQLTAFFNDYSKAFWRDIFHVMTEEVEESIHLRHELFDLDDKLMEWFKELIESHSEQFLIPVNSEEAAFAIYSASITDTVFYIYNDKMTYEEFLKQLENHIKFLFAGKLG